MPEKNNLSENLAALKGKIEEELDALKNSKELYEFKNVYLEGKKSKISDLMKEMKNLAPEERAGYGKSVNELKEWALGRFAQMEEKMKAGFRCIKLKIGAIDFDQELEMVKNIRKRFSRSEVELRVDANGGFNFDDALYKLELLSQYAIHSIEQPIKPFQWGYMAELCRESPLPIALDEELIGINIPDMKAHVLNVIKPAYIVLKPSLHGGMQGVREWVDIARSQGIGSWITSALESNVGLNAIAQLAADIYGTDNIMPQGLGTGQLFTDNIPIGLEVKGEKLWRV